MLWTHEAQPQCHNANPNAEPLSICFLPQYSTPKKVFISERDQNHDTKKEQVFGFALFHSVIDSKFSRHFFNQSQVKPKLIVARACTFSRALCRLRVITSSFDWFTGLSPSFLTGQSNYFGFGFTTLDWNPLYNFFAIRLVYFPKWAFLIGYYIAWQIDASSVV